MSEIEEVFERNYDNPLKKDGTPKPNKKLGDFEIVKTLYQGMYESKKIGIKDGKKYLIEEIEVCGWNGGSRFEVYCID
jgi:hypothetical protein